MRKWQERHNAILERKVIPSHEFTNEAVAERGRQEESETFVDDKIRQPAGRTKENEHFKQNLRALLQNE